MEALFQFYRVHWVPGGPPRTTRPLKEAPNYVRFDLKLKGQNCCRSQVGGSGGHCGGRINPVLILQHVLGARRSTRPHLKQNWPFSI